MIYTLSIENQSPIPILGSNHNNNRLIFHSHPRLKSFKPTSFAFNLLVLFIYCFTFLITSIRIHVLASLSINFNVNFMFDEFSMDDIPQALATVLEAEELGSVLQFLLLFSIKFHINQKKTSIQIHELKPYIQQLKTSGK